MVKFKKKKSDSGVRKVRLLRKYLRQNSKKPTPRLLSGGSKVIISQISCDIDQLKLELQQIHDDGPPVKKSIKSMLKDLKRKGRIDRCPLNRKVLNDSPALAVVTLKEPLVHLDPLDPHDDTDFRFQGLKKVSRTIVFYMSAQGPVIHVELTYFISR